MRLSMEDLQGDDIKKINLCYHALIFLDGVQQHGVIVADEERRYLEKYKQDETGRFILNRKGDAFEVERLSGKVEIKDDRDDR